MPASCACYKRCQEAALRYCPGTVALHEICNYQKGHEVLICKLPFQHFAREVDEFFNGDVHYKATVLAVGSLLCPIFVLSYCKSKLSLVV
eukprot:CCRYP_018046-RB/>CCRYP_018046-RB protein AED:0.26 eAED:-0.01 QI:0/-1/0/1/-1/0/1/0/89